MERLHQYQKYPRNDLVSSPPSANGSRFGTKESLRILQVNTSDTGGGAAQVAVSLHEEYRRLGHASWLTVGYKWAQTPYTIEISKAAPSNAWTKMWHSLGGAVSRSSEDIRGAGWLGQKIRGLAEPRHYIDWWRGVEDFNSPASWRLLDLPPEPPDVLHCHRLHSFPFDLRALPTLSSRIPTVITLHDAWMLSGHCSHSFECERWKTGCGKCPDLSIHPPIRRDATAFNWRRKREIYAESSLYLATPSRWLMQKVEQSVLAPAAVDARVIPNGVDTSVFRPGSRQDARVDLGLPTDARILLFAATPLRANVFKDFETVRASAMAVGKRMRTERIVLVAVGEEAPPERVEGAEIRYVPLQSNSKAMPRYYQAADVYVHGAKAETFSTAIVEAMACGIPVVATAVGGISEQVEDGHTGFLVPREEPDAMAEAIEHLLTDMDLHRRCAARATEKAAERHDLQLQARAYLDWYREILDSWDYNPAVAQTAG